MKYLSNHIQGIFEILSKFYIIFIFWLNYIFLILYRLISLLLFFFIESVQCYNSRLIYRRVYYTTCGPPLIPRYRPVGNRILDMAYCILSAYQRIRPLKGSSFPYSFIKTWTSFLDPSWTRPNPEVKALGKKKVSCVIVSLHRNSYVLIKFNDFYDFFYKAH